MMLWFVLTLELSARLQITRKCICSDWKTLEKTSRQIYKQILALKKFSQSIVFLFSRRLGFKFQTVLYLTYLRIPTNPNYRVSVKKSQAIPQCFIDLKSSVWFTLNHVLWHFSARLPVKVFKTLNGRQSHILSKFHKSKKFRLKLGKNSEKEGLIWRTYLTLLRVSSSVGWYR